MSFQIFYATAYSRKYISYITNQEAYTLYNCIMLHKIILIPFYVIIAYFLLPILPFSLYLMLITINYLEFHETPTALAHSLRNPDVEIQ